MYNFYRIREEKKLQKKKLIQNIVEESRYEKIEFKGNSYLFLRTASNDPKNSFLNKTTPDK
jgi:RNA-binding protein YhbY